jgi:hypothetical protein
VIMAAKSARHARSNGTISAPTAATLENSDAVDDVLGQGFEEGSGGIERPGMRSPLLDPAFFDDLLNRLAPDASDRENLLALLARMARRSVIRLNFLPILQSNSHQNVLCVLTLLEHLVGTDGIAYADSALLNGSENGWRRGKKLIVMPDASKNQADLNRVAYLVHAPSIYLPTVSTEASTSANSGESILNQASIILATSSLNAVARYPHWDSAVILRINDDPLEVSIKDLRERLRVNRHSIRDTLGSVDLDAFDRQIPHPRMQDIAELHGLKDDPITRYLRDALMARIAPMKCDLVNITRLTDFLNRSRGLRTDALQVHASLLSLEARNIGQRAINGHTPVLWAIRNQASWAKADVDQIRQEYVDPLKQGTA